jgi:hypothetical protein
MELFAPLNNHNFSDKVAPETSPEMLWKKNASRRSILCYRQPNLSGREHDPFLWAETQNNLGYAYLALGLQESGTEHLEAALEA